MTLSLTAFPEDLSLGLGEVGRLAFTAFWIYAAGLAPVLLVNLAYPLRLLMGLGLFLLGVGVFLRLPARPAPAAADRPPPLPGMGRAAVRARAYEPILSGSLVALGAQAQPLQAAEVIQRRAAAIQEWPFQQRRLAQIAGIVGTW